MTLDPRPSTLELCSPHVAPRTAHVGVFVLLAVLTGFAYLNTLHNEFVGDDVIIVATNRAISTLKEIPGLLISDYWANYRGSYEAGPPQSSGLYRPLTMLTYALNYAMGGLHPVGYHLGNLLLHLIDSWLLYLIALRIGLRFEAAIVAATIFAVHPLHTEAVAAVVGRAELLMSAGVLGAIWGHLRGRRILALASFAGGLLSKEQAIVLPVLLLLYDACLFRMSGTGTAWRDWGRWLVAAFRIHSGYLAILLCYFLLRGAVLGGFVLPPVTPVENPLISLDGITRLPSTMKVAGMYAALFVWPASLIADYSSNAISLAHSVFEPAVLWGMTVWGGILVLTWWSFGRKPGIFFSGAFCLLTFLPTSNLFITIGTILAERLFYLPSAGLCLLVGLAYEYVRTRSEVRGSRFEVRPSSIIAHQSSLILRVLLALVCLALILRTIVRNQDWQVGERLYRSAVQIVPDNAKAYILLGGALRGKGQFAAALDAYSTAMKLNPEYPKKDAHFNAEIGGILFKLGRLPEALEAFEQAVTLDPKWGKARMELGVTHGTMGNLDKAEIILRYAISLTPESPDGHSTLGLILNEQGRFQDALVAAEAALQRDPRHPWGLVNRAIALEGLQRPEEAKVVYEQVLTLSPSPESLTALDEAKLRLDEMRVRQAVPPCTPGLVCK